MREFKIMNLDGVNWGSHNDEILDFNELVEDGAIAVGDIVKVLGKNECPFPLMENQFCIIFNKEDELFLEEPFTLEECKIMFDSGFEIK